MTDNRMKLVAAAMLVLAQAAFPLQAGAQMKERTGKQVVDEQCAKCHAKGEGGAPKIGDREAWTPRLKQGMDTLVMSGIRGHGGMPARGNRADLTDGEIRSAITYMFNPASAAPKGKAKAEPAKGPDPLHKSVEGMEVFLGVVTAETMRARAAADSAAKAKIPGGKGYFYVSVVLQDSGTKAEIKDAQVEARVANLMSGETRKLEPATVNKRLSYGSYFQMPGKDPYTVTLKVLKAGSAGPVEVKFDLKR